VSTLINNKIHGPNTQMDAARKETHAKTISKEKRLTFWGQPL